ncbi:Uncharacterized protein BP5553_05533 [Venustampulla echinocandica]|uniref:Integral membrane protein n=1 Tax=Venustampulla echinocandica TaxID=2656787 RepID=A0A370TRF0_9HELO|nr:Uncharacterized protein BP5553_05533 [Venustampulla echinocandica]RDL38100.1 Uncharacterized protein BP5553_05533 [Venustampulla echinocandica]
MASTLKQFALRRRERKTPGEREEEGVVRNDNSPASGATPTAEGGHVVGRNVGKTRRRNWVMLSSLFYLISLIFLILTIIGNINNKAVIRDTWIFNINLSKVIPVSTPADITFVNSLARSLGLHDFYQVGLWSFCEGYTNEGITFCSSPKALFWFNPVAILLNELLAGATITLPAEINTILSLLRIASHIMFAFFLTGACMVFISIFLAPVSLTSRPRALLFSLWAFIAALLITVATIIATAMAVIFKTVATSKPELNVGADIGAQMFAFMWIATGFSLFGCLIHLCLSCCCRPGKKSRRKGGERERHDEKKQPARAKKILLSFGQKKTASEVSP